MNPISFDRNEASQRTPRFQETWCSQCGKAFGPGDSGYSHCDQHLPAKEPRPSRSLAAEDQPMTTTKPVLRKALRDLLRRSLDAYQTRINGLLRKMMEYTR